MSATLQQEVVVLGCLMHKGICSGVKKDGSPCSVMIDDCISGCCIYHSPSGPSACVKYQQRHQTHPSHMVRPSTLRTPQHKMSIIESATIATVKKPSSHTDPLPGGDLLDHLLHASQPQKSKSSAAGVAADLFR